MNDKDTMRDGWAPCPPGELGRMARRGRLLRRRQVLKQLTGATAALALFGGGGYLVGDRLLTAPGNGPGGISCEKVMRLLRDHAENKLDATLARKVASHLEACPDCGPAYRRMLAKGANSV